MRNLILVIASVSTLLPGCAIDRRGESATSQTSSAISIHSQQLAEAATEMSEIQRRTTQMEEVLAYQGERSEVELEDMDSVRRELRSLRGAVEELQHSNNQQLSSVDAFQEDVASRVAALEISVSNIERTFGLSPVTELVTDGTTSEEESGITEAVAENVDEAAAPTVEGEPQEPTVEESPVEAGVLRGGGVDIVAQEVVDNSDGEGDDPLVVAERAIAEGHPRVARAILERVIREGGDSASTPEVLYRLAETWFAEGLYEQAGLRFQTVVEQGSGESWAAWAMVRQGECFQHLGDNAGASFFWEDVLREYPGSEASELAETLLGR